MTRQIVAVACVLATACGVVACGGAEVEQRGGRDCVAGYSACLDPSAADYDCAGGSGGGPKYTGGTQVTGSDPFGLDRDGDGYACE